MPIQSKKKIGDKMKKSMNNQSMLVVKIIMLIVFAGLINGSIVFAATTITYTGPNFQVVCGAYSTDNSMTGTITLSEEIGVSQTDIDITGLVTAYNFNDGVTTFTNLNTFMPLATISTDGTGEWIKCNIVVQEPEVAVLDTNIKQFQIWGDLSYPWMESRIGLNLRVASAPISTDAHYSYSPAFGIYDSAYEEEAVAPSSRFSSGTLPVTLSTFTAQFIENTPTLYWETQSEEDNLGWIIYRNIEEEFSSSEMLTAEMIPGNGTTTEPSYYNFEDRIQNPEVGNTYYYWLESIDYSGISQVYSRVAQITIPDPSVNPPNIEPPIVYDFKNVPNPVNSNTNFQFTLDKSSMVSVSIYNILGELVQKLPAVMTQPDEVSNLYWNGKDSNENDLTPGVYFYNLIVNGKTAETKKLILMR